MKVGDKVVDVPNFAGPCLSTFNEWTNSKPISEGIYKKNSADPDLDNLFDQKYSREIMKVLLMGHRVNSSLLDNTSTSTTLP